VEVKTSLGVDPVKLDRPGRSTWVNPDETRSYFLWQLSYSLSLLPWQLSCPRFLYTLSIILFLYTIKEKKMEETSEIGGLISAIAASFSFSQSNFVFFFFLMALLVSLLSLLQTLLLPLNLLRLLLLYNLSHPLCLNQRWGVI